MSLDMTVDSFSCALFLNVLSEIILSGMVKAEVQL